MSSISRQGSRPNSASSRRSSSAAGDGSGPDTADRAKSELQPRPRSAFNRWFLALTAAAVVAWIVFLLVLALRY